MRIVIAINAMISNRGKITKVIQDQEAGNCYYFLYKGKYIWSIAKAEDEYYLCYYPDSGIDPETLAFMDPGESEYLASVCYNTNQIKTKEAVESFTELYVLIQEKRYNVDQVLTDIISDAINDHS